MRAARLPAVRCGSCSSPRSARADPAEVGQRFAARRGIGGRVRVLEVRATGSCGGGHLRRARELGPNPHGAKRIHRGVDAKADAEDPAPPQLGVLPPSAVIMSREEDSHEDVVGADAEVAGVLFCGPRRAKPTSDTVRTSLAQAAHRGPAESGGRRAVGVPEDVGCPVKWVSPPLVGVARARVERADGVEKGGRRRERATSCPIVDPQLRRPLGVS